MFKSPQICGNPSRNCLRQLEFIGFHIFFHNLRQIFRLRALEVFHICLTLSASISKVRRPNAAKKIKSKEDNIQYDEIQKIEVSLKCIVLREQRCMLSII